MKTNGVPGTPRIFSVRMSRTIAQAGRSEADFQNLGRSARVLETFHIMTPFAIEWLNSNPGWLARLEKTLKHGIPNLSSVNMLKKMKLEVERFMFFGDQVLAYGLRGRTATEKGMLHLLIKGCQEKPVYEDLLKGFHELGFALESAEGVKLTDEQVLRLHNAFASFLPGREDLFKIMDCYGVKTVRIEPVTEKGSPYREKHKSARGEMMRIVIPLSFLSETMSFRDLIRAVEQAVMGKEALSALDRSNRIRSLTPWR